MPDTKTINNPKCKNCKQPESEHVPVEIAGTRHRAKEGVAFDVVAICPNRVFDPELTLVKG